MKTRQIKQAFREVIDEIAEIREIKEGIRNPKVKAWRTRVLQLLSHGGKACQNALVSMQRMGLETLALEDTFVNRQSYINQLEAIERVLRRTLQTIEVFGRPEDRDIMPNRGEPKSEVMVTGCLKIGDQDVDPQSVTLGEVLACVHAFVKASNDLTQDMRQDILKHLGEITDNELLQPFLKHKMDRVLAHWPQ